MTILQKKAYAAVAKARKSGQLPFKPCVVCGSKKTQAHHEDYSRPLDVTWLCCKHHRRRHIELGWGIRIPKPPPSFDEMLDGIRSYVLNEMKPAQVSKLGPFMNRDHLTIRRLVDEMELEGLLSIRAHGGYSPIEILPHSERPIVSEWAVKNYRREKRRSIRYGAAMTLGGATLRNAKQRCIQRDDGIWILVPDSDSRPDFSFNPFQGIQTVTGIRLFEQQ